VTERAELQRPRAGGSGIVKKPLAFVVVARGSPSTSTEAPAIGAWLTASVTVPSIRP